MDQLILNVDQLILSFVQGSFGTLSGSLEILWRLMFIVFIAFYGYKVMIDGQFLASDLIVHCLKIIVLLLVCTQWDLFFLLVFDIATRLPSDIAGELITASASSFGTYSDISETVDANSALSEFFDRGMIVSAKLLEGAGWNISPYLYASSVWLGTVALTSYATMLIILAKLGVAILLSVGPVFILLLIFNNTKSLFEGWLRTLLNYAIVPLFVYTLLAILLVLAEGPLHNLEEYSGLYDELLSAVAPFFVTAVISVLLLTQILNITASVTGGASLSTHALWKKSHQLAKDNSIRAGVFSYKISERPRLYTVQKASDGYNYARTALASALKNSRKVQ